MTLNPRDPLPLQERIARLAEFDRTQETQAKAPSLPLLELPFKLITMPKLDAQIRGTRFSSQGQDTTTSITYSVLGDGELAFATSRFFLTGSNIDPVSGFRLTLSREDPKGALLGPLEATKIEAGDIAGGGAGGFGRGITVTNSPQGFSNTTTNTTQFVGDIQPDLDVELYHNGVLVGLQQVGEEARYEFRNIPLFVGANEFRLVFYGPLGELRETQSSIPVTTVGVGNARPIFNLALTQPGWNLYRKPAPSGPFRQRQRSNWARYWRDGWGNHRRCQKICREDPECGPHFFCAQHPGLDKLCLFHRRQRSRVGSGIGRNFTGWSPILGHQYFPQHFR